MWFIKCRPSLKWQRCQLWLQLFILAVKFALFVYLSLLDSVPPYQMSISLKKEEEEEENCRGLFSHLSHTSQKVLVACLSVCLSFASLGLEKTTQETFQVIWLDYSSNRLREALPWCYLKELKLSDFQKSHFNQSICRISCWRSCLKLLKNNKKRVTLLDNYHTNRNSLHLSGVGFRHAILRYTTSSSAMLFFYGAVSEFRSLSLSLSLSLSQCQSGIGVAHHSAF